MKTKQHTFYNISSSSEIELNDMVSKILKNIEEIKKIMIMSLSDDAIKSSIDAEIFNDYYAPSKANNTIKAGNKKPGEWVEHNNQRYLVVEDGWGDYGIKNKTIKNDTFIK